MKPVIVAIGYNRYRSLKRLLDSLNRAYYEDEVTLIISIDFGGEQEVTDLAREFQWNHGNKIVRTFSENQGLRNHIIQCMDYSMEYGAAVIFEDDIVPSPYFYDYVKQALDQYVSDKRIFALALYSQIWNGYRNKAFHPLRNGTDAYLTQCECSWGECFIGEQWREFRKWYDDNKENLQHRDDVPPQIFEWTNSWAKYVGYYIVANDLYFVVPYDSFSTNFHDEGTHTAVNTSVYQVPLMYGRKTYNFTTFEEMIKYDAFFESIDLKKQIEEKYKKKVCIDCYGNHIGYGDADLLLSTVHLSYKILESYGLEMAQPELNYLYKIQGDELFLYDMHEKAKNPFIVESPKPNKYLIMTKLLNRWIYNKQKNFSISKYLEEREMKQIAIYGMGDVGQRLYDELENSPIEVKYVIDRRAKQIISAVRIIDVDDIFESVDAVIVTAVYDFEEIKQALRLKLKCPIVSLEEIIYGVTNNMGG